MGKKLLVAGMFDRFQWSRDQKNPFQKLTYMLLVRMVLLG